MQLSIRYFLSLQKDEQHLVNRWSCALSVGKKPKGHLDTCLSLGQVDSWRLVVHALSLIHI